MNGPAPIVHEFDFPMGVGAQQLPGRIRVAVWNRCARCSHPVMMLADYAVPMVLPADFNPDRTVGEVARTLAERLLALPCPGVPAPRIESG